MANYYPKPDGNGAWIPSPEEIAQRAAEVRALRGTDNAIGGRARRGKVPGGTPAWQPKQPGIRSYRSRVTRDGTTFEPE